MIRIAICDDEKYYRNNIQKILINYMNKNDILCEIDTFSSGKAFVEQGIEVIKYKIVFLDIIMNDFDGIETAKRIREFSDEVFIVFITAYVDYTLEGYKVDAVRYLLKNNVNFPAAVEECMDAIKEKTNYKDVKKEFKFNEGKKKISLNRLLYIESKLHKLEFHVMENELKIFTLYETLNKIENELEGNSFVRVHQSFLVNLKHIRSINRYEALLSNGIKLNIPRARYKYVETMYIAYKGEV